MVALAPCSRSPVRYARYRTWLYQRHFVKPEGFGRWGAQGQHAPCGKKPSLCGKIWKFIVLGIGNHPNIAYVRVVNYYNIYIYIYIRTSASVKSYQLVKVVLGGRAPGKSSSLASPQLLVIERFHCFGAVHLEKVQFLHCVDF